MIATRNTILSNKIKLDSCHIGGLKISILFQKNYMLIFGIYEEMFFQ